MQRIGIAASKMSKGGICSYNLYVIVISCLLSSLVFLVCGFSIILIVFLISLIVHVLKPHYPVGTAPMAKFSLIALGVVVGILNIVAILKNIQFTKK